MFTYLYADIFATKIWKKHEYHLLQHLEEHKLLFRYQFGFRQRRNTEAAVTLFTDTIRTNTDNGNLTGAIFVDLSKAFDTLSHSQIIANLSMYGIHGSEREFFINYLFNRKQQVSFQRATSAFEAVTCGVPQGSILGHLLFLLSFNDIEDCLQDCKLIMYADDTVIYTLSKNLTDLPEKLTRNFTNVAKWLEKNELIINMKKRKTECMLFGSRKKVLLKSIKIAYQNKTISFKNSHVKETFNKASGRLHLLRRIRRKKLPAQSINRYWYQYSPIAR